MTIYRSRLAIAAVMLVTAVDQGSAAVAQEATKQETYTVKRGDTLWDIAKALMGDPFLWPQIYRLNTDVVEDPHWIYPGEVLKLVATEGTRAVPAEETPPPEPEEPQPQPERPAVAMDEPQGGDSLFRRRRGLDAAAALRTYREQPYRPLRRGEFYSSGFLTEEAPLPFGKVLGTVTPQDIRSMGARETATLRATVAVVPPEGAQYQVGDSLLLVQVFSGPAGYGDIVHPTGLARVTGYNGNQTLATVVAVFGAIRNGQLALPAEKFVQGGTSRAQRVDNGLTGSVLGQRDPRELKQPQNVLFIDKGRKDGVAPGDIFEIRRDPAPRPGAADTIDELMAVVQVVHVRDRSATTRILNVVAPDIPPGTRVKLVAKLPS